MIGRRRTPLEVLRGRPACTRLLCTPTGVGIVASPGCPAHGPDGWAPSKHQGRSYTLPQPRTEVDMYEKGEIVRLNTDSTGDNWVPAIVTQVLPDKQYFVTALPGPNKDTDSLQQAASEVGPIGEGVERYGISRL